MKYIIILLASLWISVVQAQLPDGISFQALAMDEQGELLINADLDFRISLLAQSPISDPSYSESHSVRSTELGHVELAIGRGQTTLGSFDALDWTCLLYTSPSPRDATLSRMPSSA